MSSPPTSKLARGAVSGLALARAGVARMGHQARRITRKPSEQDAARLAHEAELGRILFRALNQLKGTALKLSQLLASHADFLPEGVRAELAKGWKPIVERKDPLPDAEEWAKVKDKLDKLER